MTVTSTSNAASPTACSPGFRGNDEAETDLAAGTRAALHQRWSEAKCRFHSALHGEPASQIAAFNLAMAQLQLGEGQQALERLAAMSLPPSGVAARVAVHEHWARCMTSLGAEAWAAGPDAAAAWPRITLLGPHHGAPLLAHCDARGWQDTGLPAFRTIDDVTRFIRDSLGHSDGVHLALLDRRRGLIGMGGLQPDESDSTIYYWVAPEYRGRGHGHRLVHGLLRWARTHGRLHLRASVQRTNEASRRVVLAAGFTRESVSGETEIYRRECER